MDLVADCIHRVRNKLAAQIEEMIDAGLFSRELIISMMEEAMEKVMPAELEGIAEKMCIPVSERAAFGEELREECRTLILQVKEGKPPGFSASDTYQKNGDLQ